MSVAQMVRNGLCGNV